MHLLQASCLCTLIQKTSSCFRFRLCLQNASRSGSKRASTQRVAGASLWALRPESPAVRCCHQFPGRGGPASSSSSSSSAVADIIKHLAAAEPQQAHYRQMHDKRARMQATGLALRVPHAASSDRCLPAPQCSERGQQALYTLNCRVSLFAPCQANHDRWQCLWVGFCAQQGAQPWVHKRGYPLAAIRS